VRRLGLALILSGTAILGGCERREDQIAKCRYLHPTDGGATGRCLVERYDWQPEAAERVAQSMLARDSVLALVGPIVRDTSPTRGKTRVDFYLKSSADRQADVNACKASATPEHRLGQCLATRGWPVARAESLALRDALQKPLKTPP
jgi:hypothetical protein